MKTTLSLILGLSTLAGAAQAFEFKGAELGLEYSRFQDDLGVDETIGQTKLDGSVEFGFLSNFAVQFDAASHNYTVDGIDNGTTFTLHGIYDVNEQLALGAYVNRVDLGFVEDLQFVGLEAKYNFGPGSAEFYYEKDNEDELDLTQFGISGAWGFGEKFDLTAGFDRIDLDGLVDFNIYTVGVAYELIANTTLTAEIGRLDVEDENETFFGFGVRYNFGGNGGTTFGKRGLNNALPIPIFGGA